MGISPFLILASCNCLEALIEANRQRVKTNEQIGSESAAILAIERERAKLRQAENARANQPQAKRSQNPDLVPGSEKKDKGDARDKAGEKTGVNGKTAVVLVPGLAASVPGSLLGVAIANGQKTSNFRSKQRCRDSAVKVLTLHFSPAFRRPASRRSNSAWSLKGSLCLHTSRENWGLSRRISAASARASASCPSSL
jgi:hypothetical protein